jgi:hypothetical protein
LEYRHYNAGDFLAAQGRVVYFCAIIIFTMNPENADLNPEELKMVRTELHTDFQSENTDRIEAALGRLDGIADITTVGVLSRLLVSGVLKSEQRAMVTAMLRDVKLEGGGAAILAEAVALQVEMGRADLLTLAWEAGATAEDNLVKLIELAVSASFEVQIEVMTLLDELEGIEDESEWTEACSILQEAIEERDESETALLAEMQTILRGFEAASSCCGDGSCDGSCGGDCTCS